MDARLIEMFVRVNKAMDEQTRAKRAEHDESILLFAADLVAEKEAAARGLSGAAAKSFADGFGRIPAKVANPRATGTEPEYRAGREFRGSREAAARIEEAAREARERFPRRPYYHWEVR